MKRWLALVGLALVALAAALLVHPALLVRPPAAPEQRVKAAAGGAPEVHGLLLVYVNGELRYRGPVRSFLGPATPLLALGLFPTSGFQSVRVSFYGESPSAWAAGSSGARTETVSYGGYTTTYGVCLGDWGENKNIAPLLLIYDTQGSKWTEVSLSTTPSITSNSTGVLLTISGSVTPSLSAATNVSTIRLVRPLGLDGVTGNPCYAARMAEDTLSSPVTVNPGDSLTVVYQFYFKSDQVFTENWARAFFAWLYNAPGAKVNVTATDGTTDSIDPYAIVSSNYCYPPNNVPVNSYIVIGNGQASFSRTAYKVVSEVARAEPSVQVYGGGVSLSYTFTLSQDTTITEAAVYAKLTSGKEVMLLYYVFPQPVQVKAGTPFTVTFRVNLPWQDRV
jgi:hypothetical protein